MKNKKRSTILNNLDDTINTQPISGKEEQRQAQRMSRESILNSIGSMAQGGSGDRSPINAAYEQRQSAREQERWEDYVQQHAGAMRAQQIYARKLEQQQLQNAHRQNQYRRQGVIDRSRQMAAERPEQMARWLRMDADAYERKANDAQSSTRYDRFGRDAGYLGEDAGEYAAQQSLAKEYQSRADAARAQSREVSAYGEQYRRQQQEAARAEQIAEDPAAWMRWAQQQSRAARQRWESRGTDGAYNGITDGIGGGGAQTAADNAAYDEYQRQLKEADDLYRQAYAALREQEAAGQVPTQSSGDAQSARYRTVNGQSGEPQPRIIGSRAEGNAGTAAITGQRAEAYMSDEQRQTYNYLYATQGEGAAEEYYKLIEPELEQARTQETQQEFAELSERAPAAMTLLSTLASPTKIAAGLTSVGDALAGDEINTNSAFYTPVHAISAIRQTVPQVTNWTGDKQIFGQDADSYIYGVITSSLDSALNMALATGLGGIAGGAAGLTEGATNSLIANATSALMGTEMLPDTVMEEKAKGRTDEEATAIAIIRSLIEGVTEKYSIEYFLGDPTTFGKKLGKAFLAEGGEEVASNWLNNIVDVVSSDPENVLQQWRDRVDSGENGALAFAEVVGGMLSEDAASFIAGGISGLGMGAVHEGIRRAGQDKQASRLGALGQSDAQAVVDEALAINPDSKAAQRAKARLDAGKNVRSVQLGRIMAESDAAILPQEQALAEASKKYGKQAGAMQATYDGEQDVQRYDEAYHVAYEMGRAGTNLKAAQTSMATGYLSQEQRQAAWEAGRDSAGAGSAADIANGRALLGGQIAAVQSISERDGKVYAEILQGTETKRVALEDLKMDAGTRMLAESAKQYGAAAPTIFEQYRKGQQLTQYLRSADMAVSVGMASPSASSKIVLDNLKSGQLGKVMSADQIEALYKAGQQAGKAQLRKTGMTRLGAGSFTLEDSAKGTKLDKRQRASLRFLRDLARVTGLDISVYKSASGADGTLMGANGSYVGGRIRIDLNAGAIYEGKLEDASMLRTVSHELTHFMAETAEAEFKELQSFLVEKLSAWEGHSIQDLVDEKLAVAKSHGRDISTEEALEEVVADGCEMMLRDSKAIRQLAEENRTLFEKVRDWMTRFFDALRKAFEGVEAVHPESIHIMENYAEELQKLWDDALTEAVRNAKKGALGTVHADLKAADTLMNPTQEAAFSLRDNEKFQENAEKKNEALGLVPVNVMRSAAEARSQIAEIMRDSKLRDALNLPDDFSVKTYFPDGAYNGTEENTTVCPRSMGAEELLDAVSELLGRPLTVDECINISQFMAGTELRPECEYCYVATDRKAYREFLGKYIEQRDEVVRRMEGGMSDADNYKEFLGERKDTKDMRSRFDLWIKIARSGGQMMQASDLTNVNKLMHDIIEPDIRTQVKDAMRYAQSASWAKKRIGYTAYNGHILNWSKDKITKLNKGFGLRMYSFSDFSPAFILENMQMITDASVRGLKMLAYTKDLDFVRIFAPSGININVSVFGFERNGVVAENALQGASWAEAQKLRAENPNVGITFVATNDTLVNWALAQDWIDVVIPYHLVKTGKKVAQRLGFTNYTAESSDVKQAGWTKGNAKEILPTQHNNDLQTYLRALEENNLRPRFERFLDNPNYMKLVNETRRSALETPAVQPVFDVEAAKKSLIGMIKDGGYFQHIGGSVDRMYEIASDLSQKIYEGEKFSDRASMTTEQSEAEKRFGTTTDFNEAGFILPDGKMLRFTDDANAGARNYDHRAIGMMYGVDVDLTKNHGFNMESNRHMNRFVEDGGIRFDPGDPDYDMGAGMQLSKSKPLTKAQERTIRDFIAWKQERDAAYVPPDEFAEYMGAQAPVPLTIEFGGGADIAVGARSRDLAAWNIPHLTYEGGQINADRVIADIRHYYETGEVRKPSEVARFRYSERVTDKKTLDFLNRQKTVKTYKTMQLVDGKLYPPMAARTNGQYEDYSVLGQWEQATEHPELVRDGKYKLDKGKGQGSISAAYNPYMHSSNLVLNDQFSGAYARPNLVTVECEVPVSELTSGYRADGAKDAVGWHAWHTGTVAGQLRAKTGTERQVLLSRWIKPVRILSDAEVAQMYKRLLNGTDIAVPDNVVTPSLLRELRKVGVSIKESGRITARNAQEGVKFSDRDYSYEALTEKPDMEVTEVSGTTLKRRADIIFQAKQNAAKIGTFDPKTGSVSVYVKDIGTDVVIGTNGLKHGLDRRLSENGGVTLKAGEILQNSIRINELTPEHADADAAFVLIGAAKNESGNLYVVRSVVNRFSNEVTSMDVLYAMNAKKENQLRSMRPGFQGPVTGSTISISDLLGYVNEYFPDVLPEGVLRHFGYDARPAGVLGESALFQERDTAATEIATLQRDLRQMQAELKRLKAGDVSDLARVAQYDAKEALRAARQDTKAARAEGVLTGKMEQGRAMAKQMSRLEAQKNAQIARLEQRIAETQKRMNDRIAEQRQRLTDYRENRNESDARRHQREQVEKQLDALAKMLTTNNDKLHIPEGLKQPLKELLEATMPTRYSKRMMSGGTSTKADISLSRTLEKIRKVVTDNEQTGNFGYLDLPPGFLDDISGMTRFVSDKMTEPLYAMNSAQLKELNKTLKALAHSIRQMNQLITAGHFQSVAAASEASVKELKSMSERKLHFGLDSAAGKAEDVLRNFLSWKNTTPYYAFRRFGEGGQDMFRRLADGWDRLAFNSKAIMDFAEDTYTEKEVKAWEKEKHTVALDSGEVITLSTANAMELYELSKRQQALGHLLGGGVRVANQRSTPAVLTTNDIDTIIGLLTERQREVADKLQEYMELQGSEWGNEVSMKRFGYRYFTEQNYYPVVSDSNELSAKNAAAQENSMYRLLNLSMTKGLQEGANNAIVIGSIFDTFASHMSDMAKYNALALPILDTMKWYNYRLTEKNEAGQLRSRNVKQSVEAVYGADALRYFTTFLEDLNGVSEGGRGEGFANKMISNYKVAAVAANLRVALLQPTAYVRAANVLSPKYLLAAMKNAPKAFWNASGNVFRGSQNGLTGEMLKYSGIALWKSLGFYDTNIGRSVREQIKNAAGIKEKVVEKSMSLAELGDTSTWTVIWSACKMEQKSKGYTGQALLQKTAERFREVVYATQVVDSTMTRSHMMRSKSTFSKLSTAFMSEPTLSYNMLLDAAMGIQMENRRGNNGWKTQSGKLFRAFTVFAATAAASALVESLFDAFRDDDDEDGMTKFIQALFGEKFLDGNLGQNLLPIDSLPYLKDAVSILQGYSNERMDTAFISKIVSVAQIWKETANLANGTLDAPTKVTSFGSMTTWGKIYKTLDALSSTIGLPLAATTREVTSIWNATIGAISPRMKIKRYENKDQKFEWLYSFAQSGSTADYEKELAGLRKVYGIGGKKTEDEITENIQSGMREKIQAHFLDGDISAEEAQKMLDAYAGAETGDAKAYVAKWSCEKDLGVKYDDIKDLYLAGEITDEQAVEYRVKYGLQDEEKAQDTIAKWRYEKETGNATDSASMAGAYFEYAEPAGIGLEMFETAWAFTQNAEGEKDSDGKTISGSVKAQVVEYIQSLGLSRAQAKALWDAVKGDWKDKDTPWA